MLGTPVTARADRCPTYILRGKAWSGRGQLLRGLYSIHLRVVSVQAPWFVCWIPAGWVYCLLELPYKITQNIAVSLTVQGARNQRWSCGHSERLRPVAWLAHATFPCCVFTSHSLSPTCVCVSKPPLLRTPVVLD